MGRSAEVRCAGTLSYMAPEHLESIHTPSTEKSDVYSFAIVVWVVLTGQEPYASELGCHRHILSYFKTGGIYTLTTPSEPHTNNQIRSLFYVQVPGVKTRSASVFVKVIDQQRTLFQKTHLQR